jgi:hypothetical protein
MLIVPPSAADQLGGDRQAEPTAAGWQHTKRPLQSFAVVGDCCGLCSPV